MGCSSYDICQYSYVVRSQRLKRCRYHHYPLKTCTYSSYKYPIYLSLHETYMKNTSKLTSFRQLREK